LKIKDKRFGQMVNVYDRICPTLKCYWPRQRSIKIGWLCGTREARGCPDDRKLKGESKC